MARRYLEEKGYEIIEQNYKTKYSEIDLVAKKDDKLVFVEVRTKIGENFGTPEETLNNKKLAKVRYNALSYSAFKKWQGPIKIDAICIVLSAQGGHVLGGKPLYLVSRLTYHENIV